MNDNVAASNQNQSRPQAPRSASHRMTSRYKDAYAMSRLLNGFGWLVKICAYVLLAVAILGALVAAESVGSTVATGLAGVGIALAVQLFLAGILFGALGQLLKAALDTAVNTSPFLTKDEMRAMLFLD